MARVAYVDGAYQDLHRASVAVEDRGLQFADSVYEVVALVGGRLVDLDLHLARLSRSRAGLGLPPPGTEPGIRIVLEEVIRRNRLREGLLYLQVTRGHAPRSHGFPAEPRSTLMVTLRPWTPFPASLESGVGVVSGPDLRWRRCDLKTTGLLPNVLAKQRAAEAGAFECWMVRDGVVTEGASSNAWIVRDGCMYTHPLNEDVLGGVTRKVVLQLAAAAGLECVEQGFRPSDVGKAEEAFLTSTSSFIVPVVVFDGATIGSGVPGPMTRRVCDLYRIHVNASGGGPACGPDAEGSGGRDGRNRIEVTPQDRP